MSDKPKAEIRIETHPTVTPILLRAYVLIDDTIVAEVDPKNILNIADRIRQCHAWGDK